MKLAYVDTSCLVAVALGEPGSRTMATLLGDADQLFAANLLEAEFRAAMQREDVTNGIDEYLSPFSWILPERALTTEIRIVLEHGYIRGADLWHLSCALYLSGDPNSLPFLTLDDRQRTVATAIGFPPH